MKIFAICTFLVLFGEYRAQEKCQTPTPDPAAEFPDIFSVDAHMFSMEISFSDRRSTMYVTEYYNRTSGQGKLDMVYKGVNTQVLAFKNTDELFVVSEGSCKTSRLSTMSGGELSDDTRLPWFPLWSDMETDFFGPSAILKTLRKAMLEQNRIGKKNGQVPVRQILTEQWVHCLNDTNKVEVFLAGPMTDAALGLKNQQIPIRIVVTDTSNQQRPVVTQIEFVGIQMYVPDQHKVFQIPVQVGCTRLDSSKKQMPTYDGDLSYKAEVVYRTTLKDAEEIYVSLISVAIHKLSQHVALQLTPWKVREDRYKDHDDNLLKVYDMRSKYLYVVDKTTETCNVSSFEKMNPTLGFPDKTSLSLMDPDIFITNTPAKDFHYLGEAETRGIYTSVYEKILKGQNDSRIAISTRYHLNDGVKLRIEHQAEKNVPLRVTYLPLTTSAEQLGSQVDVNYFAFETRAQHVIKKFDVSLCFPEDSKSKWFQFVFPLESSRVPDVTVKIPYLEENFFDNLNVQFVESPLRFPVLKVDVDSERIYVTGRILDRPDLFNKYRRNEDQSLDVKQLGQDSRRGMLTLDECAKACFGETDCKRFSYCGAMCDLDTKGTSPVTSKQGCTLYEDVKPEDDLPTMEDLLMQMDEAVQSEEKLKLTFPDRGHKPMTFTASKFMYGTGFGMGKQKDSFEDVLDDRLTVLRYGSKFDPSEADESGKGLKERSLASCQRDCLQSPNCLTMSYCKVSGECFLSTKMPEDIPDDHFTEDTKCIVYYRSYLQFFDRYAGIFMPRKAEQSLKLSLEDCAKQCVKSRWSQDSCKSFDFCPQAEGDNCLLHKVHLADSQEKDVAQDLVCGHYSRKYLLEYRKLWHKEFVYVQGSAVYNVTAEWCAKTCKGTPGCQGFDHCVNFGAKSSTCRLLRDESMRRTKDSPTCTAFLEE